MPVTAPQDVPVVVAAVASVQPLWAQLRLEDRARYLRRAAQAVIDEWDELVEVLVREQGRPRAEAQSMELLPSVETLQWLAAEGPRILGEERLPVTRVVFPLKRARQVFEPLGVVAVITPAAEPWATPLGDVAVALMGGNGVVLAPSTAAALAAERIGRVLARAGLPEGLVRIVHGGPETGTALVSAPVAQVRFTGSAPGGREVGEACARELKRAAIDVNGKDPMLVLADAGIPRATAGAVWAAFANAGQAQGSVKRAYVLREAYDRFLEGVVRGAHGLRVGDPSLAGTDIGPLTRPDRVESADELVRDALAQGATLHCGGRLDTAPGLRGPAFAPAVLTGVPEGTRLRHEETLGPVLTVAPVDSEEEGIACCNAVGAGLGASVWTADRHKGRRIARELRAGMVFMNDHLVSRSAPQLPWGGVQGSGLGRARGGLALRASVEPKLVTWDSPAGRPPWWPPYDATFVAAGRARAHLRSARDRDREAGLRSGTLPLGRITARTVRAWRR